MRFRSILHLFKQDNWSNELVEMVREMLELGEAMFKYTTGVILNGDPDSDPQGLLYDRDIRINQLERIIRRRVVSRLSIRDSRAEVPTALIFMNVVKDSERIGDYIKNLYEVIDMMPDNMDGDLYRNYLAAPTAEIGALFDLSRQAFGESNQETAALVIQKAKASGRGFEKAIRELTVSDLATNDAVCLVLILRFYKRVVAHMSNIATTVVMPLDLIDFYDEPKI